MSKPEEFILAYNKLNWLNRLFTARIDRLTYIVGLIFTGGIIGVPIGVLRVIQAGSGISSNTFMELNYAKTVILITAILTSFFMISLNVRRFHDMNISAWAAFGLFIPYANILFSIYLVAMPGNNFKNNYGDLSINKYHIRRVFGIKIPLIA